MTMQMLIDEVETLTDRYGEQVMEKLLALAPLVAGSGNAWRFAVSALEQGEDGLLVIHVPGLPGEPPTVTWMGSGWHMVAEQR